LGELTRAQVRELLRRPEELLAVWPGAVRERLDVIVPRHLERAGFRFVADHDGSGPTRRLRVRLPRRAGRVVARPRRRGNGRAHAYTLASARPLRVRRARGATRPAAARYRRPLHDALLTGLESPTADLSTEVENEPVIALNAGRDRDVIVRELDGPGFPLFLVMGRALPL
jgi:hypothetical protein